MLVITLAALIGAGDGVGHWLGASTAVDRRVSTTFADHRTSFLDGVTQRFSQLGSTYVVIGIALTVIVIGLARRRRNGLLVLTIGIYWFRRFDVQGRRVGVSEPNKNGDRGTRPELTFVQSC